MKYPLTNHRCINPECLHEERSHKCPDARRCIKCGGIVISEPNKTEIEAKNDG